MLGQGVRGGLPSFVVCLALGAAGCSGGDQDVGKARDPRGALGRQGAQSGEIAGDGPPSASGASGSGASAVVTPAGVGKASANAANVVPGQVIVKYKSSGRFAVTECVERWMAARRSFDAATADRSTSLDRVHAGISARAARALMPGRRGLSTLEARRRLDARSALARQRLSVANVHPNARTLADLANVYVLEVPANVDVEAAARRLAADPHVEYAQPNYRVKVNLTPNDPFFSSSGSWGQGFDDLWGLKKIGMQSAWDVELGDGVIVAVVDSGLDLSHPDIAANVWQNPGEIPGNGLDDDGNGFVDDVNGWNFGDGDGNNDPSDRFGHGTHVAGTIAAVGNDAAGVIGVAPQAKIQPINALPDGGGDSARLAQAILYAAQNGARVINNSWGCPSDCPDNPLVEDAVDFAHDQGVTVVFGAGNSTMNIARISPQNQPNVIVVAAADRNDARSFFSNFGFLDVTAPGGGPDVGPPGFEPFRNILSLKSAVCAAVLCPPELVVGGSHLRQAGTSMSAPHVSGLAALIIAQHPEYTPEQVRQVLRRSSVDVGPAGVDSDSGYGRIDAAAALAEPVPLQALITAPAATGSLSASTVTVAGTASGPGFASYSVDFGAGPSPSTFTPIASSTTPVSAGTLAIWDVSAVPDGDYALRVRATTSDGRTYEDRQPVTLDRVFITEPMSSSSTDAFFQVPFFRSGDVITVRGTVAPPGLASYTLSVLRSDGTPLPNPDITLTNGGTSPVTDGVLGTWNTTGVPADSYRIVLTANLSGGGTDSAFIRVVVDPTLHPGWPVNLALQGLGLGSLSIMDELTAADVDGDGSAELVVGYADRVSVLDHTGADLPGWPQSIDPTGIGAFLQRSPAVADVTGDGIPEVIAANNFERLFVWNTQGELLYEPTFARAIQVAADDVDGDAVKDVVVTNHSGFVTVLDAASSVSVQFQYQIAPGAALSAPSIGDVDADGDKDIAVISRRFFPPESLVYLLDASGVRSGWPKALPAGTNFQHPVIGDVDADGQLDVAVASNDGTVSVFAASGAALPGWPKSTAPVFANGPTLGDLDGDGKLDVLAGSGVGDGFLGVLFAWRHDGSPFPGFPIGTGAPLAEIFFGYGPSAMADIDGDGDVEAIVSTDGVGPLGEHVVRSLRGFNHDGTVAAGFPKLSGAVGAFSTNVPAIADCDGDGLLELAWVDVEGRIYMWDLDSPATAKRPWPMFQHDSGHTGRADAVEVVAAPSLRARFRAGDTNPSNNVIQPQLRIVNDSAVDVPLSQITIRYWYTDETAAASQIFQLFFAQNQSNWASIPASNVTSQFVGVSRPLADRYLEIGFTAAAGTLVAGSAVALDFNIHAQNWANYLETNDHSYSPSTVEIDWNRITVYVNGTLAWGVEP